MVFKNNSEHKGNFWITTRNTRPDTVDHVILAHANRSRERDLHGSREDPSGEKAATTKRDGHGSHEDPSGGKGATIKRNLHGSHEDPLGEKAATTKGDNHGSHEDPSGGKTP